MSIKTDTELRMYALCYDTGTLFCCNGSSITVGRLHSAGVFQMAVRLRWPDRLQRLAHEQWQLRLMCTPACHDALFLQWEAVFQVAGNATNRGDKTVVQLIPEVWAPLVASL